MSRKSARDSASLHSGGGGSGGLGSTRRFIRPPKATGEKKGQQHTHLGFTDTEEKKTHLFLVVEVIGWQIYLLPVFTIFSILLLACFSHIFKKSLFYFYHSTDFIVPFMDTFAWFFLHLFCTCFSILQSCSLFFFHGMHFCCRLIFSGRGTLFHIIFLHLFLVEWRVGDRSQRR